MNRKEVKQLNVKILPVATVKAFKQVLTPLLIASVMVSFAGLSPLRAQNNGPYCLDFDGSNEHVDLGNNPPSNLTNSDFTVSLWVKIPTSTMSQNGGGPEFTFISANQTTTGTNRFALQMKSRNQNPWPIEIYFYEVTGSTYHYWSNTDIQDNKWHHVALTYDKVNSGNDVVELFIDGTSQGTKTLNGSNYVHSSDYVTIGGEYDGGTPAISDVMDGFIDEVRIWGDLRTKSEIQDKRGETLSGSEPDLVGYYQLNEGSGTTTKNQAGSNYDGTLDGNASQDWVTSYTLFKWTGSGPFRSGWNNSGNWSGSEPPSSGDHVFLSPGLNDPSIPANSTFEVLKVGNSGPTTGYFESKGNITINDSLILNDELNMKGHTLVLKDNIVVRPSGGAKDQLVRNGSIKKIGDDAFKFPLGNQVQYAPLKISAPNNTSDAFTASYTNSSYSNTSTGSNLNNVSAVEYWDLDRTNGSSSVDVTLYWEDGSQSGSNITKLSDLVVAHWNASNTEWESLGQSSTSGSTSSGSITVTGVSNFSPFTFGSKSSSDNPLPVELLHFTAQKAKGHADLKWATASETNNSHFVVQKWKDDQWQAIGTVEGHGTANTKHSYKFADREYQQGNTAYYRLKQVDYDGSYAYSEVRSVSSETAQKLTVSSHPNPVADVLHLEVNTSKPQKATVFILDLYGQKLSTHRLTLQKGENRQSLNLEQLEAGQYFLKMKTADQVYHQKFIKE